MTKCLKNNVGYEARHGVVAAQPDFPTLEKPVELHTPGLENIYLTTEPQLLLGCPPCHQLMGRLKEERKMSSHLCGSIAETVMEVCWASEGV